MKRCLLILIGSWCSVSWGQQLPLGSQYFQNMFLINPAYTGTNETVRALVAHRSQYNGLQGGPQTSTFGVHGPVKSDNVGLGLIAYTDKTDILIKNSAMVNYSYGIQLKANTMLQFGVGLGAQNYRIDFDQAYMTDSNDPILSSNRQSKTVFNADAGVVLMSRLFQVGFAVPQLFTHRPNYDQTNDLSLNYRARSHYRGSLVFDLPVSSSGNLRLMPSGLVRFVPGAPTQFDVNGVLDHKKAGWIGFSYHHGYSVAATAGVRIKGFTFGYAHDFPMGVVARYAQNSSEFLISYDFIINKAVEDKRLDEMKKELEDLKEQNARQQEQLDSLLNLEYALNEKLSQIDESSDESQQEIDSLLRVQKELLGEITALKKEKNNTIVPAEKPKPVEAQTETAVDQELEYQPIQRNASIYIEENGKEPPPGFYLIVGSFMFKNNAYQWKQKSLDMGNKDTKILYNKEMDMREVYVYYTKDRAEAKQLRESYTSLTKRVWVLELK